KRDVEILVLRSGAVIGKVQALLKERIQIGSLPVSAAAARMLQHASNDAVGATTVFGDLFEIAGQHPDRLKDLGAFSSIQRADGRSRSFLQLVQKLDRETSEIVDEIERVLDLVGDAGGQLSKRRHLLRMDQARLRFL